jgi:hypothetical protein
MMFLVYKKCNSEEFEILEREKIEDFGDGPTPNFTWRVENDPCWPLVDAWNQFIKKTIEKNGYWIGVIRFQRQNSNVESDTNFEDPFRYIGLSYNKDALMNAIKEKTRKSKEMTEKHKKESDYEKAWREYYSLKKEERPVWTEFMKERAK